MAEEDANGLTMKDRMEIRNRDEICMWLDNVLSTMYEADRELAAGFKADNIMAMRQTIRSVHETLQSGRSCLWTGMAGIDQALLPGVKSLVPLTRGAQVTRQQDFTQFFTDRQSALVDQLVLYS
ncbi:hypothetical protein R1sor_022772 [Riccia sorocarpa]|uniref:Uncharacterized protein n=1 Tax=Riccia sorocarpa TaxID=122646 RepID=A0ABD3GML5_9MARC